jgi:hypothetical protein
MNVDQEDDKLEEVKKNDEAKLVTSVLPGVKSKKNWDIQVIEEVSNTMFSVKKRKIICKDTDLRQELERRYDWTKLMELILKELTTFHDGRFVVLLIDGHLLGSILCEIRKWLKTFHGWGLTLLLIDHSEFRSDILDLFIHELDNLLTKNLKDKINTDPEVFYNSFFSKESGMLDTKNYIGEEIRIRKCFLMKGPDENNRKKILRITLYSLQRTRIDVEFEVEKFPPPRSLLNRAAEVIGASQEAKFWKHYAKNNLYKGSRCTSSKSGGLLDRYGLGHSLFVKFS